MVWRDMKSFPDSDGVYGYIKSGRKTHAPKEKIDEIVKKSSLYSDCLIATPADSKYYPIALNEEYKYILYKKYQRLFKSLFYISAFLLLIVIYLFSGIFNYSHKNVYMVVFIFSLLMYFFYEIRYGLLVKTNFQELSLYYYYCSVKSRGGVLCLLFIQVCFLIIQFIWYLKNGSFTDVVSNYGALYSKIDKGEYWRFVSGPLFHANFTHWICNTISLIISYSLMKKTKLYMDILLFILACSFSAFCDYIYMHVYDPYNGLDGFVGVSGGVYTFLSITFFSIILRPEDYPKGLLVSIFAYTYFSFLGDFLNEKISYASHVSGLFFGFFISIVKLKYLKV